MTHISVKEQSVLRPPDAKLNHLRHKNSEVKADETFFCHTQMFLFYSRGKIKVRYERLIFFVSCII